MTRPPEAASAEKDNSDVNRRPDALQGARWDLDLLTPDDVCALLKVKKSWLYDTVEDGAIEVIRLGKQLRLRPSALLRYLEDRASSDSRYRHQARNYRSSAMPMAATATQEAIPLAVATTCR